ncbi:Predicted PurR-regulated permease PerM [Amycolatopsis arida]|uniref:Predicted PurR-regulated permease PerM n=1 Tax=Amycolatopsis arida TaxID=587909 RepID=A0A1I5SU45_9PSEU|nr:AI-2E family transporter [Amycolatopsis arida]TDX96352.1 putative PurR-regulated permease PerM [Amycolatopsis arida]SFP74131.1 Predicted PurR-regulated permease PerM [Amycolatopsis arida]
MPSPDDQRSGLKLTTGGLRQAAVLSVQLLAVALALWVLVRLIGHFSYMVIPLLVALLLAAILGPPIGWLAAHRVPRGLAVLLVLVVGLGVVGGLFTFVGFALVDAFPQLRDSMAGSVEQIRRWLAEGPLSLDNRQLNQLFQQTQDWIAANNASVFATALGAFSTLGGVLIGTLLALVALVMLLGDGPKIWNFVLRPWRPGTRELVDDAGREAFHGLVMFIRTTALVALIDAVFIAIGLLILRVPLVLPLATLVFIGGFVPYAGAFVSGALVVGVALVSNGPVTALLALGVVVLVQQLEGNVLHPLITGNIVRLHPIVVLFAITVGGYEAGIAGALFAVPVVLLVRGVVLAVVRHRRRAGPEAPEPEPGDSASES